MCGFNFTRAGAKIDEMNQLISHRGLPGKIKKEEIGIYNFGHVRLPIQGLSEKFDQPFFYKNCVFLFVGEIFNYKTLMPSANSDIEVLAETWLKEEMNCFKMFDGFWSVLIYNTLTHTIDVFTDYLAKKPIYIHPRTGSISSEIKPLLLLDNGYFPNELYFSSVSKWGYCLNDRVTPFKNVEKMPAGLRFQINHRGETKARYYDRFIPKVPTKEYLRKSIEASVHNRLTSDIPISLLLSGGLDSTIIYKLIVEKTHNFTIFHFGNEEKAYLNYLDIPSGVKVVELDIDIDKGINNLNKILWHNESPVDLGSMLPQFLLSEGINKYGLNVAISGDGADELFGGYKRIEQYDSQLSDIYEELVLYHLPRLDKLMMANTVELRCPYLSKEVIELALGLPYKDRINKSFLKSTFEDIIPKPILERKKYPLKSKLVLEDPIGWRLKLVKKFRDEIGPAMVKGKL